MSGALEPFILSRLPNIFAEICFLDGATTSLGKWENLSGI